MMSNRQRLESLERRAVYLRDKIALRVASGTPDERLVAMRRELAAMDWAIMTCNRFLRLQAPALMNDEGNA